MDDGYAAFAEIYDAWQRTFGPDYSDLIAPRVEARLERWAPGARTVLDLACGTGTHALAQARRGRRVIGVDLSEAMLRQARAKAAAAGLAIGCIRADMRTFQLGTRVDAVTCLYASLNHLAGPDELAQTFTLVRADLNPGGAFIFDLNTAAGFAALWRMPAHNAGPGFRVDRTFTFAADSPWTVMHLRIERAGRGATDRARRPRAPLEGAPPGGPSRTDRSVGPPVVTTTTLRARWFHNEEVASALVQAGLRRVDLEPFNPFPEVSGDAIKQLWTAAREG
ncbi:MAG: methyltransferase domain-containing protein [Actinobacteria bacterium]|nr:methyltransferase domain-containing protein [Actinomycetota bacterium]